MGTVKNMLNRIQRLDYMSVAAETLRDVKEDYKEWQKEQLFAGKRSDKKDIKPAYTRTTKSIKRRKGQPTDRVTLKDTGHFYDSIYLVVTQNTFKVTSSDVKNGKLIDKYSEKIFGLGGVFKIGFMSDFKPAFLRKVKSKLRV
jgi:hypothetical protein